MNIRLFAPGDSKASGTPASSWLNTAAIAEAVLTSIDPAFSIESALEGDGPGWRALTPGRQVIHLRFERPQKLRAVFLRFEAGEARTQELLLRTSADRGATFRDLVRQQFNFSASTSVEEERYAVELDGITNVELTITPDISGGTAVASLAAFQFGTAR